ncbi:MAG TPA: DUF4255 domain-containing protein [Saprospiraceae bacterium]|nr:DUF4255 domain-containing protein [Saprospiraceae bacterium]
MIAHALHIVVNELNKHFTDQFQAPANRVVEGNIGMGVNGAALGNVPAEKIILSVVNYKEEKTLKNLPHYVRNDSALKVTYENPPVFINFMILMTATHSDYLNALIDLSRIIRFFQSQNVFTPETVSPLSVALDPVKFNPLDSLESFKLIFDLYSPSFEEVNHMWGTLGGKQYPFVMYLMRMLELKFRVIQSESGVVTEIQRDFFHTYTARS